MEIVRLYSIKNIEKQYGTGDLPVLVTCSDLKAYICKYMRSSSAAYRLASELIGAYVASKWDIPSPSIAFVSIQQVHWSNVFSPHSLTAPAIGYAWQDGVIDITPTTYKAVKQSKEVLGQLLKIALMDFWMANEDRTFNNANLLYNAQKECLISIDYGGILNTSTFDYPIQQLTVSDSILYADLFRHLSSALPVDDVFCAAEALHDYYVKSILACDSIADEVIEVIPKEWKVAEDILRIKLSQLFENDWQIGVWNNFMQCLKENLE